MAKNTRNLLIILVVMIVAVLINRWMEGRHESSTDLAFTGNPDQVTHVQIFNKTDTLNLIKTADTWTIPGVDSLVIRDNRITNLFDNVLKVKKETLVSRNPDKWKTYSVDDSSGLHLKLYDKNNKELAHIIMGRSTSEWTRNNIRIEGNPNVYLTNANVMYQVNPKTSYWGEKPKPPAPPDTTEVDSGAAE